MQIVLSANLFQGERYRPGSERFLEMLLELYTRQNELDIREAIASGHPLPDLYHSGIVYRREEHGRENWQTYLEMLEGKTEDGDGGGVGDCEDLAAALAGQYRARGIHAVAYLERRQHGNVFLYHCKVRLPNGRTEDPSKILGMGRNH